MGNDMVQPADKARGVDSLPFAPCISRDDQHSFVTRVAMVTGTGEDVFCNKDHVAKRDVQMRGTMARWEVHWTARDLADLCPSRPMRSVSKLTSMQVNWTSLLFAKDVKI